jgi:hypothetical protein
VKFHIKLKIKNLGVEMLLKSLDFVFPAADSVSPPQGPSGSLTNTNTIANNPGQRLYYCFKWNCYNKLKGK